MKSKIKSIGEVREWNNPKGGKIYYRDYSLENGETVNLGSQEENPSWGIVGAEIELQEAGKDSKGNTKYKRVTPNNFKSGGYKQDTTGMMVGNAITNAVSLISSGKADIRDLEIYARRICDISVKLKSEFENK